MTVPKAPPRPTKIWPFLVFVPLILAFVVGAGYGLFIGYRISPKAGDRDLVLTVDELAPRLPGFQKSAAHEKLDRRWHIDASVEVTYEYDATEGTPPVYLTSSLTRETSSKDASVAFHAQALGVKIGGNGLGETPRDDLLKWGDESRSTVLTMNGVNVGNFFMARKGARLFTVMLSGTAYEDPAEFQALIRPHLARMDQL